MDWLQLLVLAIVQGITEFLPISSSAHLILVPTLTGWTDQGLAVDVATHVGTLLAVVLYFHRDSLAMLRGVGGLARGGRGDDSQLLLKVALGTVPVVIAGLLLKDLIESDLRSATVIAATTIGFGLVLWVADRRGTGARTLAQLSYRDALLIGLAQMLALVPGTSRSGITMTAGLFLGFSRTESARFSLLLSIPTTLAAVVLVGAELIGSGNAALQLDALIVAVMAFFAALAAISAMMTWLKTSTFTPFVVYRLILGVGLLIWLYT